MGNLVSAARKAGMNNADIAKVLSSSSVSRANISALLSGNVPPWRPTASAASYGTRKAGAVFDAETAARIRDNYQRAMRLTPASAEQ